MIPLKDNIPSRSFPFITLILLLANVTVYIYQLTLGYAEDSFIWKYGAVAYSITTLEPVNPASTLFPWFTLLTAQFVHGSIWHLGGNMLFLWIFGDNVEDRLGHFHFLAFFLVCGVLSIIAQVIVNPDSAVPLIGASGAIAGVMGAYMVRFPRARILVYFYFTAVWAPALIFLGLWFIFQLIVAAPSLNQSGGVAYFAHVGGFVVGMILFKLMEKS
jgi:membrane associated rhomboid family serine protease